MNSQGVGAGISPALAVAQRRLDELRQQHQRIYQNTGQTTALAHGREPLAREKAPHPLAALPDHLGWHCPAVTRLLRQAAHCRDTGPTPAAVPFAARPVSVAASQAGQPAAGSTIKLHPDLALGLLRQGQAAVGRIWLLLRHLDPQGKGWIEIEVARQELTAQVSPLRVCGWRQLRNLLAQGEGLFWRRRDNRIWLAAMPRVAAALGIRRLEVHPVTLPVTILCAPIGELRAHFYASFHSSRRSPHQNTPARPIARATLEKLTQTSRHTLRTYERRAGVRRQVNFAVGPPIRAEHEQEVAWRRGRAFFKFTDHKGLIGRPRTTYSAWQLPNSYHGPHERLPKGSQKQLNQQLADLSMKGMTGNGDGLGQGAVSDRSPGGSSVATSASQPQHGRRFFDSGAAAGKKYGKNNRTDLYWPGQQIKQPQHQIWHVLPGNPERKTEGS